MRLRKGKSESRRIARAAELQLGRSRETAERCRQGGATIDCVSLQLGRSRETAERMRTWLDLKSLLPLQLGRSRETAERS